MNKVLDDIRHSPAKIRIGKKGLTETIIMEVEKILRRDKATKIKCLNSVPSEAIKAIADNIAKLTNSKVIEIRGKTFILFKET